MRILFIGPLWQGSTSGQRLHSLRGLGHELDIVDTSQPELPWILYQFSRIFFRLGLAWDFSGANNKILTLITTKEFDIVWVEKGLTIRPSTLVNIRLNFPAARLVSYCIDDMVLRANQSRRYIDSISNYDYHVTNKTYNVDELKLLGAREVLFFANAYDPVAYYPRQLSAIDGQLWSSQVAFLGGFEDHRFEIMLSLAKRGIEITIWGPGWEPYVNRHNNLTIKPGWVQADDAAKIFCSTAINLHFLRKVARDLQTTRSVEIPACGAFMIAERTQEHQGLFREGIEAEFYSDIDELIFKIQYFLNHTELRELIGRRGYTRCVTAGYSYPDRLREILHSINASDQVSQ